jgi:hypothetical protein
VGSSESVNRQQHQEARAWKGAYTLNARFTCLPHELSTIHEFNPSKV